MEARDDLSELLQHEYDHLDGILAVSRAIDGRSFALKNHSKRFHHPFPRPPAARTATNID
jgi:peptide deformylase